MTMRMLIDARHREETRVAVVKGNRVEEFDFESAERKQLKGNIYLAKVTRVEPSLQAAFVDYGGNRHGFLAFSEIHPDYYQIPKEDREALLREEAEHAAEEEALRGDADDDEADDGDHRDHRDHRDGDDVEDTAGDDDRFDDDGAGDPEAAGDAGHDPDEDVPPAPAPTGGNGGEEHAVEGLRERRMALRRRYKIQDVIRRRQVLLVQVVKEERGNKGAALTTYLSLAGRYCVLMPNTSHGGGISRKISSPADRKRLKTIMADLQLPPSMGCIVRTAGLQRTRAEIKRDFDYLARLWDEIRETTLGSSAPALVHADSDLIKRAIRDIYNRDIDEVLVEGEDGFRLARSFMKLLMPSHAKKVQPYADAVPLFQRFGVEDQLAAMYQPLVQLKSGGYLVINPTEALVSIDINSGRSTREHNIEQTAVNTNLEAAGEIARQLRLRDMAGLVVIDFIDMESSGNVRKVEKAMKGALANDRARIQVGRISSFGLFEMSRQRLRTGVLEASTRACPHCEGTGLVRTASSAGLSALRIIEDEAARGRGSRICLRASQEAAFYVLNRKRAELAEIEDRYGVLIEVVPDGAMEGARMNVSSDGPPPAHAPRLPQPILVDFDDDEDIPDEEEDEIVEEAEDAPRAREGERGERAETEEERADGRRRRRRRRRRGRREDGDEAPREEADGGGESERGEAEPQDADAAGGRPEEAAGDDEEDRQGRRGRRGRRGGRRRRGEAGDGQEPGTDGIDATAGGSGEIPAEPVEGVAFDAGLGEPVVPQDGVAASPSAPAEDAPEAAPRPRRRPRARKDGPVAADTATADTATPGPLAGADDEAVAEEAPAARPRRSRRKAEPVAEAAGEAVPAPDEASAEPEPADTEQAPRPRRRSRTKATLNVAYDVPSPAAEVSTTGEPAVAIGDAPDTDPRADADIDAGDGSSAEPPRRGWWQRTFGN